MINLLAIPLGILLSAGAQLLLKKGGHYGFKDYHFLIYFCLAGTAYGLAFGVYSYLLRSFPLSRISPIMTLGTMIVVILSGVFLFKEQISLQNGIGIVLGIVALTLLRA